MRIAVLSESSGLEPRVALSSDTAKRFVALGAEVVVASGAGLRSGILDADYAAVGATIVRLQCRGGCGLGRDPGGAPSRGG